MLYKFHLNTFRASKATSIEDVNLWVNAQQLTYGTSGSNSKYFDVVCPFTSRHFAPADKELGHWQPKRGDNPNSESDAGPAAHFGKSTHFHKYLEPTKPLAPEFPFKF